MISRFAIAVFLLPILVACGNGSLDHEGTQQGSKQRELSSSGSIIFAPDLQFDQIKKRLRSSNRNEVSNSIIQLMMMRDRPEVVSLVQAAWDNEVGKYPDLNWKTLQDPFVRVSIARVLGRWNPGQLKYRAYILSEINNTQGFEKLNALSAFGSVATDMDVQYLENIAKQPDELASSGALSALQMYGSSSALEALERINNDATISENVRNLAAQMMKLPKETRE